PRRLTSPLGKHEPIQTAQVRASTYSPRIDDFLSPSARTVPAESVRTARPARIFPCFIRRPSSSTQRSPGDIFYSVPSGPPIPHYGALDQVVEPEVALSARLAALRLVHRLVVRSAARVGAVAPVGRGVGRAVEARDDFRLLPVRVGDDLVEHVLR